MAASTALASAIDVRAFIDEYFGAWQGTDEERILSYYADWVSLQIPGTLMNGRAAVRDQFVSPFIGGFPGNRHIAKNMIFGRDVVVVEWSFEAEHKGHARRWRRRSTRGRASGKYPRRPNNSSAS